MVKLKLNKFRTDAGNIVLNPRFTFRSVFIRVLVSMVGYHIHGSVFWGIIDWLVWPAALIKWMFCNEISLSVIKATFAFFFA